MTTDSRMQEAAEIILAKIDETHPEAAAFVAPSGGSDPVERAARFIAYLRARQAPNLGYPREMVDGLIAKASEEDRQRAREALKETLNERFTGGVHHIKVSTAEPATLFIGGDEDFCREFADYILSIREHWDGGSWGITCSIGKVLRRLFVLPTCPDEALIPLLARLIVKLKQEWEWARTWDGTTLGDTGHNWWLHTFFGFYQAGVLFPELKGYSRFISLGQGWIEREARMLFEVDGYTKERAAGYQYGSILHLINAATFAMANGVTFSDGFQERMKDVAATTWKLLAPNGDRPRTGDCGYVHEVPSDLAAMRSTAALLGISEAKYVAEALDPDWQPPHPGYLPGWGENLWQAYQDLPAREPSPVSADTALETSGYYCMRQNWTPHSDWMCIDAGARGPMITSHDHAAIFSFELYSHGTPILIDNCSGPYADEPVRLWRMGTSSHNTTTVDGMDQVTIPTQWRKRDAVHPWVNDWIMDPEYAYFGGAHEG
ncbi:MAG: heparinase II/III domain-containing protein, partial [Planctomycetota bacterium]